jgi:hypothetical protein
MSRIVIEDLEESRPLTDTEAKSISGGLTMAEAAVQAALRAAQPRDENKEQLEALKSFKNILSGAGQI